MLKKFAYNKIFRTTGMLFLLLFLLLYPTSKEYSLDDIKAVKTKRVSVSSKKNIVYLIDKDGYVARYKVSFPYNDDTDYAKKMIELLVIGGKYEDKIPNGFKAILPTNTEVIDVKINNNDIEINLSNEFKTLNKENYNKAIDALIYNLTSIKNVKNLYIKVDGKRLTNMDNFNINIKQPFTRDNGINKSTNLTNYKDISSTTIYYINKNKDNYYYVPVTKVSNDKRDKIKIIIDELTSSSIYETNLMSFLNYNTKLLNYNIDNEKLTLNFNNYLLDDENSMTILEEVIYTISLSIKDNYDVEEVLFDVNGKEITKSVLKNVE